MSFLTRGLGVPPPLLGCGDLFACPSFRLDGEKTRSIPPFCSPCLGRGCWDRLSDVPRSQTHDPVDKVATHTDTCRSAQPSRSFVDTTREEVVGRSTGVAIGTRKG